jgi:hypothetical protein
MAWFFRNVLLAPSQSKNTVLHEKERSIFEIPSSMRPNLHPRVDSSDETPASLADGLVHTVVF